MWPAYPDPTIRYCSYPTCARGGERVCVTTPESLLKYPNRLFCSICCVDRMIEGRCKAKFGYSGCDDCEYLSYCDAEYEEWFGAKSDDDAESDDGAESDDNVPTCDERVER